MPLDKSCYFKVHNQPGDNIALQTDRGSYLRRLDGGEYPNYIFSRRRKIVASSKFRFVQQPAKED